MYSHKLLYLFYQFSNVLAVRKLIKRENQVFPEKYDRRNMTACTFRLGKRNDASKIKANSTFDEKYS